MATESQIIGGRDLDAALQSLPAKVEKNIMRAALRAGATVFRKDARERVPQDSGALRSTIRASSNYRAGQVTATVKAGGRKAWYWHFVEFGTAPHRIAGKNKRALAFMGVVVKDVQHPGARAKPFMRPAFDSKAQAAIQAVADKVRSRLTAEGINVPAPVEPDDPE